MLKIKIRANNGFAILDAIIAMSILTIMVLGTTMLLVTSIRIQTKSLEQTRGQEIALAELKLLKKQTITCPTTPCTTANTWPTLALDKTFYDNAANASKKTGWNKYKLSGDPLLPSVAPLGNVPFYKSVDSRYDVYIYITCEEAGGSVTSDCKTNSTGTGKYLPRVVRIVVARGTIGKAPEGIYSLTSVLVEGQEDG